VTTLVPRPVTIAEKATVVENGDCRRIWRLLPNSATNCRHLSPFPATTVSSVESPVWTGLKDVFGGKR